MSYYSRITGAISIEPPLTWAEYKDSTFRTPGSPDWPCVILRQHEESRESEGGVMLVRWADGIIPATDESIKAYELEDEVRAIVNRYRAGHSFSGYLEIQGEEGPDLWRLYMRDGQVVRVEPKVVWPGDAP